MEKKVNGNSWVYVVVQNPGSNSEQFLGFIDKDSNKQYIPAFLSKDEANGWLYNMPKKNNTKYEVQAVIYEDLCEQASENNFDVHIVSQDK